MIPLISAQAITKFIGDRALFSELTLAIHEGERVAIIGPNGAGKSTLLKVLAQQVELDEGIVSSRRGLKVSYVPQQETWDESLSIFDILAAEIGHSSDTVDRKVAIAMGQVGLTDKTVRVKELSGGWKKRLSIAKGLIQNPELLLLDEPTNHLDIDGIEWLEELLVNFRGTIAVISHDRYFIEAIATRVVEIDKRFQGGFYSWNGNYSAFIEARGTLLAQMQSYQESLSNKVRREVEWLRAGAKARTTKSKHRTDEALRMVDELSKMEIRESRAKLGFSDSGRKTRELIKSEDVSKSYGDRTLFSDLTFTVEPGHCLGIVGINGSGKSSLLKILVGDESPDRGRVVRATRLNIAYFDQTRAKLDPEATLQKALCGEGKSIVFQGREIAAIAWAKRFLFRPEQLLVPVKNLSGGEQARVLLAKLMLEPADVLVLDEPTNDLDIQTLEVLENSIEDFPGAVLLVTHDRYLLDRVSTSVVGLSAGGRSAVYATYLQWEIDREQKEESGSNEKKKDAKQNKVEPKKGSSGKITYGERLELEGIEAKIATAESVVTLAEDAVGDPAIAGNQDELIRRCEELSIAQRAVDDLYARWEQLLERQKASS